MTTATMQKTSRKEKVLTLLKKHRGTWIPGYKFVNAKVGGTDGLRRLRELREDGKPIEMRRDPDNPGIFQYRLPRSRRRS